jgi:hypothetical protein
MTPEKKLARNARNKAAKLAKAANKIAADVLPTFILPPDGPRVPRLSWINGRQFSQSNDRKGRSGRKPENSTAVVDHTIGQLAIAEEAKRKSDELEKLRASVGTPETPNTVVVE